MKMKELSMTIYEAFDGRRFDTIEDCQAYERKLKIQRNAQSKEYVDVLSNIKYMCSVRATCDCNEKGSEGERCPYYMESRFTNICAFGDSPPSSWKF